MSSDVSNSSAFANTQSRSEWDVNFNLTGAPVNTPVIVEVHIAYDFTINAPFGSAGWGLESNEAISVFECQRDDSLGSRMASRRSGRITTVHWLCGSRSTTSLAFT